MKKLSLDELKRMDAESFREAEKFPVVVVLDNIRSMHNTGSVFRTADAFRLEKIFLCGITATPPDKEINKTALGATDSVAWEYVKNTRTVVKDLQNQGYRVYAVEQCEGAIQLDNFYPSEAKTAIVLGNEVRGVQQSVVDICDGCVEIPQYGTKHSLNVSVSTGIVIWDLFCKRKEFAEKWK